MKTTFLRVGGLGALALFAFAACTTEGDTTTAGGGIGGTGGGISFGTVTDFGSIWVNGVEFDTSNATIFKDEVPVAPSELRRGMTVEIRGSIDSSRSGRASRVYVEEAVRGPVEPTPTGDANAGRLTVLGQTVFVDDVTRIDDNVCRPGDCTAPITNAQRFAAIRSGDILEVHGHRRHDDVIIAQFIERKTATVPFAVRGIVAGHDPDAKTFSVGGLSVNYGSATIEDMPGGNWNSVSVDAKGGTCAGSPVCGTFTVSKIERDWLGRANAARAEIEGFVTSVVSASEFTMSYHRVLTTPTTVYAGGAQNEIAAGAKLEIEGSLVGGVLTATKVRFKDSVRLESNATVSGSTMTLEGLPGITVTTNTFTAFKNAANLSSTHGRNVRIRGRASGTNTVIASEIEDRGPSKVDGDPILQAAVAKADVNVSGQTFQILGVSVEAAGAGVQFKDIRDNPIDRVSFFSTLAANGGLVKAKGSLPAAGGNAMASGLLEEAEIED